MEKRILGQGGSQNSKVVGRGCVWVIQMKYIIQLKSEKMSLLTNVIQACTTSKDRFSASEGSYL